MSVSGYVSLGRAGLGSGCASQFCEVRPYITVLHLAGEGSGCVALGSKPLVKTWGGLVSSEAPTPLESVMGYRDYCMHVRIPSVRGILTAMVEIGQKAVFDSPHPLVDGSLIRAVRLAVDTEKA